MNDFEIKNLTDRQVDVLMEVAKGNFEYNDIAKALYISNSTVRSHLAAIFLALGVHTHAQLVYQVMTNKEEVEKDHEYRQKNPHTWGGSNKHIKPDMGRTSSP
jgi:DNA-binding CsgD family transcriptional regulator